MLDDFIAYATSQGETQFEYASCEQAQRLLIEFNQNIDQIIEAFGCESIGRAVSYAYSCLSGMIYDALDDSVADGFDEFYRSLRSLYELGFAKYCERFPGFQYCTGKLAVACYMFWDMDGIERVTFRRPSKRLPFVEPLIDFGLCHDHPVVQASFLHCLGHQRSRLPKFVDPKLSKFLERQDLSPEIVDYARHCQTGKIL